MPSDTYTTDKKESFRRVTTEGDVEFWWRIWATSKGGTYFHIEVKDTELDKAPELLGAKAQELDAI